MAKVKVTTILLVLGIQIIQEAASFILCSFSPDPIHSLGLLVNCSKQGLHAIPHDLPTNTTTLLLSYNRLTTVPDDVFLPLGELRDLDLSRNWITSLQHHAFRGLTQLTRLSLWNNCLLLSPQTYPPDLFLPLISLNSLIISHNFFFPENVSSEQLRATRRSEDVLKFMTESDRKKSDQNVSSRRAFHMRCGMVQKAQYWVTPIKVSRGLADRKQYIDHGKYTIDLDYPDQALSHLINLRYLSIDGLFNKTLGPGFSNLTRLIHLDMNGKIGYCYLDTINRTTFAHLPTVSHLNLSECGIRNLTRDTFMSLQNLEHLDLSFNQELGFDLLGKAFYGLSFTKLTSLTIDSVVHSRTLSTIIYSSELVYFRNLQYLERLQARFNRIEAMEVGALCSSMPPNLTYVNVDGNLWELATFINDVDCLKNLRWLDMNGLNTFWTPPLRPPDPQDNSSSSSHLQQFARQDSTADLSMREMTPNTRAEDEPADGCIGKKFHVPPQLETFRAREFGLVYKLKKVRIHVPNTLKKIDLSRNHLPMWYGPLCGFDNVTELYLRNTLAEHINHDFFSGFPALEILDISENTLRKVFENDKHGSIFRGLKNLRTLDLSSNDLGHLPHKLLLPLKSLEKLHLSINGIGTFTITLSHMNKLRHLDISQNQLHTLPKEARDHLDKVAETYNVTINMTFNPIACICHNIDFLKWIRESKVNFGTTYNYYCQQADGSLKEMDDLMDTTAELEHQCGSYVGVLVGASACSIILVMFLLMALGYRFRWKLRYLYYASRLSLQHHQQQEQQQHFDFDAFVSFSSEDNDFVAGELRERLEDCHGLKLCIHTRDFTPGHYIASKIVDSIQRSRHTLLVLTRALLDSDWCHYELQMALMESVYTGRDVLLFLLYQHVPAHELPRDILANLQARVYIEYPENEVNKGLFWARLAQALRE